MKVNVKNILGLEKKFKGIVGYIYMPNLGHLCILIIPILKGYFDYGVCRNGTPLEYNALEFIMS